MSDRKPVLLRFPPDLLERVDEARGVVERTPFLVNAITAHMDALDAALLPRRANFGSLEPYLEERAAREVAAEEPESFHVLDEDGTDLGFVARRRGDGVLEIS